MAQAKAKAKSNLVVVGGVAETASRAIAKAAADLTKATDALSGVTENFDDLIIKTEEQQAKLDTLEAEYSNKVRQAKAELELQILENKEKTVNDILSELGKTAVQSSELDTLREAAVLNQETLAEKVAEAMDAGKVAGAAQAEKGAAEAASEHAVAIAKSDAKVESLESIIESQKETIQNLRDEISQTRQAQIEIAKANGNASVVVNTTDKGTK